MASLDKMAFRGIRSFDDKEIHMIQFYTPLTVIVGHNGSGKTTIIECLKYATTGDMPPNTKGGAFIHDPSMATSNEVKAQVRLRFFNTNKVRISCVRNVQVTKKKTGGLTMKTLESLLSVDDPNKPKNMRTSLSTKCAELDEEIPRLLGVSKAVLDNVIFCHQEDSNWPLSEGSNLKKKFDDIFEATRYTKALDNIKLLRKERAINLKVGKAELDGLKNDKERADALRNKTVKLQDELGSREGRLDTLNTEIEELTASNKDFYDKAVKFRETLQRAETLEEKRRLHEENMHNLKMTMTELRETEGELQSRKESFRDHLQSQKNRQDGMKRKIEDKQSEISRFDSKYYRKLSEKGALEGEKKHHEEAIKEREDMIREMSSRLNIKGYNMEGLSEGQIRDFTDRVEEDLKKKRKEWDMLKERHSKEDSEKSSRYQDLKSTLRAKEGSRDSNADGLRRLKERVREMQQDVDAMAITALDVQTAEKEYADLVAQGTEMTNAQAAANYDGKIRNKNEEIRRMDEQREVVTNELNTLNRQADFRAKLDMKRKSAEQKRVESNALLERHADALYRVTGKQVNGEDAESDVNEASNSKEKELKIKERAESESSKQLQHVETTMTFAKRQLKEKETQANQIEKEIQEVLEGEFTHLDDAIEDADKECRLSREALSMLENATKFFDAALRQGQEKHSCLTCGRGIKEDESAKVLNHMKELVRKSQPAHQKEEVENLRGWQDQLHNFTALKPKEGQMQALRSEDIPLLREQVQEAEEKLNGLKEEAEQRSNEVDECKAEIRELGNLRRIAADIGRMLKEVKTLHSEALALEKDLANTGSARTGDQVQQEIDELADGIKRLKRELQSLQQDKETTRTQFSSHERNVHRAEMTMSQKKQEFDRREGLAKRLEELQKEQEELQQRLNNLQRQIETSSEPIRNAKEDLEQFKVSATRLENDMQSQLSNLSGLVKQLEGSEHSVQSYVRQRGAQKLQDCEDTCQDLQRQSKEVQGEVVKIEKEVAQIEKDLNESRATERNIHDNLRYMQLSRDIKIINEELSSLDLEESSKLNKLWTEKYNTAKRKENDLNGKAAHIGGEIASLKSQIKAREHELRDEYKNVDKRFVTKLVEVKTSELANNDLELFQKALHAGIMKFHSIKMEEINQNLSVLWGETYQGTDIDTISIRADGEGAGVRSTYNYRVVMVKDSVEMDMRGRCSAGQKCLASILIRLALADSFSANCGIMALDEPTTNLDGETVSALAESLSNLIKERRAQSNFQLIIITHDENFLSMLSRSTGLEWYFRVAREQVDHRHRSYVARERV
ncbi:hypothetical protein CBS101457_006497 [Exobasidium rhododendri]|nr:hypothetical protein CBS101457_006497 [Exobasidium rhododendri]